MLWPRRVGESEEHSCPIGRAPQWHDETVARSFALDNETQKVADAVVVQLREQIFLCLCPSKPQARSVRIVEAMINSGCVEDVLHLETNKLGYTEERTEGEKYTDCHLKPPPDSELRSNWRPKATT